MRRRGAAGLVVVQMTEDNNIEIRDRRGGGWFYLHNRIIDAFGPRLGPCGLAVYAALVRHADNQTQTCYPSHFLLARETGVSRRQVQREVKKIAGLGLLSIESRGDERRPSIYTLLDVPDAPPDLDEDPLLAGLGEEELAPSSRQSTSATESLEPLAPGSRQTSATQSPDWRLGDARLATGGRTNNTHNKTQEQDSKQDSIDAREQPAHPSKKKSEKKPLGEGNGYEDDFEGWWSGVWRHIAKAKAKKAYLARRREGISPATLETARDRYVTEIADKGTEEQFQMYPATFLGEGRRFEDYLIDRPVPLRPATPAVEPKSWGALRRVAQSMGVQA